MCENKQETPVILVVDDEAAIRHALRREFRVLGFTVVDCPGSLEALELFTRDPEAFQLVVLDYYMPRMDGLELAEALRAVAPKLPILLITAGHISTNPMVETHLRDGTIQGVVQKPWKRQVLQQAVKALISGGTPPDEISVF